MATDERGSLPRKSGVVGSVFIGGHLCSSVDPCVTSSSPVSGSSRRSAIRRRVGASSGGGRMRGAATPTARGWPRFRSTSCRRRRGVASGGSIASAGWRWRRRISPSMTRRIALPLAVTGAGRPGARHRARLSAERRRVLREGRRPGRGVGEPARLRLHGVERRRRRGVDRARHPRAEHDAAHGHGGRRRRARLRRRPDPRRPRRRRPRRRRRRARRRAVRRPCATCGC